MSKLEKARDRLEELRGLAIAGPWTIAEERTWSEAQVHSPNGPIADAGDYASSNATFHKDTAYLIVTLYATIDAQIALLDDAIAYRNRLDREGVEFSEVDGAAVSLLADAILKGA